MIYTHHDFYSNFTSSVKSGDDTMTIGIIVNEISDLIVFATPKLVAAMNKVGLKATINLTDEELVDSVLVNLPTNANLLNAISFLIAEYNDSINKKGDKAEDSLKVVKNISTGLSSISKQIGADSKLKASVKKDIMEQIVTKSTEKGDYKRVIWKQKKSRKKLYFILGGLALTGLGIYLFYKYKESEKAVSTLASLGMGVDGLPLVVPPVAPPILAAPAPIVAQPIQVVAPAPNPVNLPAPVAPAPIASNPIAPTGA